MLAARSFPSVLLIEDDPGDVILTKRALADANIEATLHVTGDGVEALQYLRQEGQFEKSLRPSLILLDLNLPKKDGRETLAEIKADANLRKTPVVVLTTSDATADINYSYELHANCYLTKPEDLAQFRKLVKALSEYWLSIATLPNE